MSAFICNRAHITALAVYAFRHQIAAPKTAKEIAHILARENLISVNFRYQEIEPLTEGFDENTVFRQFSAVQIIKAAHCLSYQSCEHDNWPHSEAFRIVEGILAEARKDAGASNNTYQNDNKLVGYSELEWEISPLAPMKSAA